MKAVIAVDLDGFLTTHGPTGRLRLPDFLYFLFLFIFRPNPNEDNLIKVKELKRAGYKIVILSARPEMTRELTEKWLKRHDLNVDEIILVGPGNVQRKKFSVLNEREIDYYFGDSGITISYLKERGIFTYKG